MTNNHNSHEITNYLDEINAEYYFNDVISLLIKLKPERPVEFMYFYFQRLNEYDHAGNRDFSFITETNRNRLAFISSCDRAFSHFDDKEEMLIGDFYQLITLLCPSIPETRIFEIPRLLKHEPNNKILFQELKGAFFIHFVYYDFLVGLKQLFVSSESTSTSTSSSSTSSTTGLSNSTPIAQGGGQSRRLIWCPVEFNAIKNYYINIFQEINDKQCQLPIEFIENAYLQKEVNDNNDDDNENNNKKYEKHLTFDELVYRLLKNQKLAFHVISRTVFEWSPRNSHEAISELFTVRNSRGEIGPEDFELNKYTLMTPL